MSRWRLFQAALALLIVLTLGFSLISNWKEQQFVISELKKNTTTEYHRVEGDDQHDLLPTCQELMQQPFSPFADGSFLTRITTPVTWKMRRDGSRELTLPTTCRLKRYTAEEAGQCLKKKHLLFIGDSLSRYSYLSLAYFMEHKKWPPRFGQQTPCNHVDEHGEETCSKPNEPNVCMEGDWQTGEEEGWVPFVQSLGGGTDGDIFNGRMEVPSVRGWDDFRSVSNMQYVSSKEDGRTKLSYVGESGWFGRLHPITGWNFTGCAYNASCRYTPEQYEHNKKRLEANDFDWEYPLITDALGPNGITFHHQYSHTNYAFYNRGLWGRLPEEKAKMVMELLFKFTGSEKKGGRCFFRSTTGCIRTKTNGLLNWEHGVVRKASYHAGCEYLDASHLTAEFTTMIFSHPAKKNGDERGTVFWDAVHYQPWVYEELNNMQLNILCNAQN
uniref:Trichome birefringence-like N-terminal domain-containing protein n=1 Tax=Attheya septentrionalis TaxID=420275 RepID=A0A7S2U9W5_9STRA|mmetsp:Transcript_16562/g.30137  ORF Transcript_16562/g.30137 Transcript_16562/m.30137 type:complete len:442 (+) Transcript_16562:297-1622(+)